MILLLIPLLPQLMVKFLLSFTRPPYRTNTVVKNTLKPQELLTIFYPYPFYLSSS